MATSNPNPRSIRQKNWERRGKEKLGLLWKRKGNSGHCRVTLSVLHKSDGWWGAGDGHVLRDGEQSLHQWPPVRRSF